MSYFIDNDRFRFPVLFLASMLIACPGPPGGGATVGEGPACEGVLGDESCPCQAGRCFDGLVCLSNVCVDPGDGNDPTGDPDDSGDPPGPPPTSDGPEPEPEPEFTTMPDPSGPGNETTTTGPDPEGETTTEPAPGDADGDGWTADEDCDDGDPNTYPLHEGDRQYWWSHVITESTTICPGRYHRASITVVGTDIEVSGYEVILDGDDYDYYEDSYIFPFITVKDSSNVAVRGFQIEDFRGKTIAVFAKDSEGLVFEDLYVTDFVQAAGGGRFGTIYTLNVLEVFVGHTTVVGNMGRITMLGGAVNQVLECTVTQEPAVYPEAWPPSLPPAILISGSNSDNGYAAPGEAYIDGNSVTVLDTGTAIEVRDGYGGSLFGNNIFCSFLATQVGVRSASDDSKSIGSNFIDGCSTGIIGVGSSTGNNVGGNDIDNAAVCIQFDPQTNFIGPNACN